MPAYVRSDGSGVAFASAAGAVSFEPNGRPAAPPPAQAGERVAWLHPFSSESVWNLPIATGAALEPTTSAMTVDLRTKWGVYAPWINFENYSHPVNHSSASDPTAVWTDPIHRGPHPPAGPFTFPTPVDLFIATGSDRHAHVLTPDKRKLHETFAVSRQSDTALTTYRHHLVDLHGDGVGPQNGTRAYGGSAIGGLIRAHEVDETSPYFIDSGLTVAGKKVPRIPHALAIALVNEQLKDHTPTAIDFGYDSQGYSHNRTGYVWPATETDGDGPWNYLGSIPMGQYLCLDPAVNVAALGLSWAGTAIALAAQDFGVYVTDRSGSVVFYLEVMAAPSANVTAFRNAVRGNSSADVKTVLQNMRVVSNNGPTTPNGGSLTAPRRRPLATPLA